MKENITSKKSIAFAVKIINLYKILVADKKEFVLSKQLLRSGTAIGALIREAEHAESKADFLHKMNIALKEANETDYWLLLLKEGDFLNAKKYEEINNDCTELIRILASIVKTTKANLKR
ncbi:MAG: four helix bundle protein [Sphingobacteriales bacterium]|nr:four helix bundle protein [Sphingobacteriales bacterium]